MLFAESSFEVAPSIWLMLWTAYALLTLPAALVTAAKGQWLWLLIGLLTAGLGFFYGAFRPAAPDSVWGRRRRQ